MEKIPLHTESQKHAMNAIMASIVSILSCYAYNKNKIFILLIISFAFGIFAITHLIEYLYPQVDKTVTYTNIVVLIRVIGYILMIYGVYKSI